MSRQLRGKAKSGSVSESFRPNGLSGAGVFARDPNGQPLAPFLSATAERLTPPFSGHARTESVRLCTSLVSGTVSGLAHGTALLTRRKKRTAGRNVRGICLAQEVVLEVG